MADSFVETVKWWMQNDMAKSPEECILLYQIFKDTNALDHFRLCPDGLDINMLPKEEAHKLVDFAKYLLHKRMPGNESNGMTGK